MDVSDGKDLSDSIDVTMNLTDVAEGTSATACEINLGTLSAGGERMGIHMNAHRARLARERRLWAEAGNGRCN